MKTPQKSTTSLTENRPEIQPEDRSETQQEIQPKIQSEIQLKNQPPALPLISIIIPIYNAAKFLDQTIASCLKQDYPHLEIILINDGSTDDSQLPSCFLTALTKVSVPPETLVSTIFLANIFLSSTLTISWQKILSPPFTL